MTATPRTSDAKEGKMDAITVLEQRYDQISKLLAGLTVDQMSLPTPCTEWDVRTLLNHLIGCMPMFTQASRGIAAPHDEAVDALGADPAATFAAHARENLVAWRRPGAMRTMCPLPPGTMPGEAAVLMNASEALIHGWDLATAIGGDTSLDEQASELVLRFVGSLPLEAFQAAGALGPPVQVPADASAADRLIAISGRQP